MKIEQLRQVMQIYQDGSINKAAQSLFISQPCISSSLKSLENQLGQKIFNRSHTGIALTDFGKIFIQNAQKILTYADEIELASKRLSKSNMPRSFSVSVYYLRFAHVVFHELLQKYQDTSTNFRYHQASISDIIADVYHRSTELGLISIANIDKEKWMAKLELDDLFFEKIYSGIPNAMLSKSANLSLQKDESISLKDLNDFSLVLISEKMPLLNEINKKIRYILKAKSVIEVNDRATNHEFLENNRSYACVVRCKEAYASIQFFDSIHTRPIQDLPFSFEIGWVYRKDTTPSDLAREYMNRVNALLDYTP